MSGVTRRQAIVGAAWSMPVIALAIATPAAAASVTPPPPKQIYCTTDDPDVESVTFQGTSMLIHIRATATNAIDVTVRQEGYQEYHVNLLPPGIPTNGVPDQENYRPGEIFYVELWRPYDLGRDWQQVKTIHNENCVVIE